jgi:peptide alpha-N-acetyltransferase
MIEEILLKHINSIKDNKELDKELNTNNCNNFPTSFIWVHYYAALHYDYKRDLETALNYINQAINSTQTVPEFYIVKSKLLNHGNMLPDSIKAYNTAKRLDLGDRYLNAKFAKIQLRNGEIEKGVATLREFVKDPLSDDNLEHLQCMWFETECGYAYLRRDNVLQAYRLFKSILQHFHTLIEDQVNIYYIT